jgi:hypothetical protein
LGETQQAAEHQVKEMFESDSLLWQAVSTQ